MSRIEENERLCEKFMKMVQEMPAGEFEEIVGWQLGAISSYLADISRSLAVMADKVEPKEKATVAAKCQDDDLDESDELDEKQIKELQDSILNALKEAVETKSETQRKTKCEVLNKLRNEIIESYIRVEGDYDRGRNYGLFMATRLIEKYLKEM